jgi:DNA (cytosine-5)-methyltransferase 1
VRAVDLFAGWGGFTRGAHDAGASVVWASNHWELSVRTHALNHPTTTHVCQDLRQADWTTLPAYDLLLASPACQGHSSASQPRRRRYHDAMRATAFAVLDCADVTEPAAVIVENVPAFSRWRLFDLWCEGFKRLGYRLDQRLETASHHGVPQRRQRLFIIATRPDVVVPPLQRDPAEPAFAPSLLHDRVVPTQAWRSITNAPPGVQTRIARGVARLGPRFLSQHTTGHAGVDYVREPIRTITTAPCHWNLVQADKGRYRALTPRELARGMGFPDSFYWPSDVTVDQATTGLGNAVCPPVATALIGAVASAL